MPFISEHSVMFSLDCCNTATFHRKAANILQIFKDKMFKQLSNLRLQEEANRKVKIISLYSRRRLLCIYYSISIYFQTVT